MLGRIGLLGFAALLLTDAAQALPFTAGNLVVGQVGADGSTTPLGTGATEYFVKEMTSAGTLVQVLVVPSQSGRTITLPGSAPNCGLLSASGDRISFGGYWAVPGSPAIVGTSCATTPRTIGSLTLSGAWSPMVHLGDAYDANEFRNAAFDGANYWTAGTAVTSGAASLSNGLRRASTSGTTSLQVTGSPFTTAPELQSARVHNGFIYFTVSADGVLGFSSNPPTAGALPQLLPGLSSIFVPSFVNSTLIPPRVSDFAFADSQTLYVSEINITGAFPTSGPPRGGVYRLNWNSSTASWQLAYRVDAGLPQLSLGGPTRGARTLAVSKNGQGQNVIYAVSGETAGNQNGIYVATDLGSATTFSLIQRSPANCAYRGLAIVPPTTSSRTISGTLTLLDDWIGSATNATSQVAEFELNNGAAILNVPVTLTGSTAAFSLNIPTALGTGPVKLRARLATFLRSSRSAVNIGSTNVNLSLRNGDTDGDGLVSILDYLAVSSAYESVEGQPAYGDGACDLDKDGLVSILDYLLVSIRYDSADEE